MFDNSDLHSRPSAAPHTSQQELYEHQPSNQQQQYLHSRHEQHIIPRHAHRYNQSIGIIGDVKREIDSFLLNLTASLLKPESDALHSIALSRQGVSAPQVGENDDIGNLSLQLVSVSTMSSTTNINPSSTVVQVSGGPRNYSSYEELELLSSNWQIVLVIVYSLTAAIALVGNVIAIWVLMSGKRSSKELRLFLVNLSLADITMAVFSIPFTYTDFMLGRWIFAPSFCPIVQLMQMTSVFVSVYTLTAIGIDRYIAIIYPLLSTQFSRTFGSLTILSIWLAGFTLGFVQWANTRAIPFYIANELNFDCKELWSSDQSQAFTFSIFILTFALPMCILMFVYGSVSWKMFRHSTPGNADLARDRAQHSSKIKIIKMLATIVILFAICWLPLHILNLFIYFARDWLEAIYNSPLGFNMYVTIAITAHWFSMSNSFVNPIIYCFMSENFRSDLRVLLRKCLRRSSCYHKNVLHRRRRSTNSRMLTLRSSQTTCRTSIFATSTKTTSSSNSTKISNVTGCANGYRPGTRIDKVMLSQWLNSDQCQVLSAGSVAEKVKPTLSANGQAEPCPENVTPEMNEPTAADALSEAAMATVPSMTSSRPHSVSGSGSHLNRRTANEQNSLASYATTDNSPLASEPFDDDLLRLPNCLTDDEHSCDENGIDSTLHPLVTTTSLPVS